jgi:hypothetical protein
LTATGLGKVRPTATATADFFCQDRDQFAGMQFSRQIGSDSYQQVDLAFVRAADSDNPGTEFVSKLVCHLP